MLNFLDRFEQFVADWADNARWSIAQIAEKTHTDIPMALEAISTSVDKFYDVHEAISRREAENALNALRTRLQQQIESQKRRQQRQSQQANEAYELLMEKIRTYQSQKNWRHAYRSLSYFYGKQSLHLDDETKAIICNDCLRLGIKAETSIQELSHWLQQGIRLLLKQPSELALEDAIDFIDAYSDYFMTDRSRNGAKVIQSLTSMLIEPACQNAVTPGLTDIVADLNLPNKEIA